MKNQLRKKLLIGIPYTWFLLFFLVPFIIVFKISFSEVAINIPPYNELLTYANESLSIVINLGNYLLLASDNLYVNAYINSIIIAFNSTLFCLLLGYPMAYAMSKAPKQYQLALLMLILLPSWTSFLIRIYAWIALLKPHGIINNFFLYLGIITTPIKILHTQLAIYIGIVYAYLPFMVLPLYANLMKHDKRLLEASRDLGAKPWKTFLVITLPLSKNGIIAGSLLVFIPAIGEFVIPELLGNSNNLMIGHILWQEFFNNRDWPVASALAMVMLISLVLPISLFHHYQSRNLQ